MATASGKSESPPLSGRRLLGLYLLLGFSAGLPFYMFTAVLSLRLALHGVDVAIIGFFAWVALLPTFKFLWAPLLERWSVPGFTRYWGRRRGWIMLAQLGIFTAMLGMASTSSDESLPLTALFAVALAFWTTTLEIAADGWRIELAPTQAEQAPVVAANLWGYRSAMVAAGSGAVWVASQADWTWAYLAIAAAAFLPFPILVAMRAEQGARGRAGALAAGLFASAFILASAIAMIAVIGWAVLGAASAAGIGSDTNVTPFVLAVCILPFVVLALLLPRIRRMGPDAPARRSASVGPYVDIFWRYGFATLIVLGFVSAYRVGDVLALALNHPMWNELGYSLGSIAVADGVVSLAGAVTGVGAGGWAAARWPITRALLAGAIAAAASNWVYVWLWSVPVADWALYTAVAVDQFGNGMAGAVFVVYLSMLVNPRYPAAQYAFLSGFAFLFARLLAGASGTMQKSIGYDGFFLLTGAVSLAAVIFLPAIARIKAREPDERVQTPAPVFAA
jgi:MFS transporter, PAT family, beta-lactamase induction signal transducer AmpG